MNIDKDQDRDRDNNDYGSEDDEIQSSFSQQHSDAKSGDVLIKPDNNPSVVNQQGVLLLQELDDFAAKLHIHDIELRKELDRRADTVKDEMTNLRQRIMKQFTSLSVKTNNVIGDTANVKQVQSSLSITNNTMSLDHTPTSLSVDTSCDNTPVMNIRSVPPQTPPVMTISDHDNDNDSDNKSDSVVVNTHDNSVVDGDGSPVHGSSAASYEDLSFSKAETLVYSSLSSSSSRLPGPVIITTASVKPLTKYNMDIDLTKSKSALDRLRAKLSSATAS
jgi:hypothetical protein